MKGISVAVYRVDRGLYCPIALGPEKINLGYHQIPRGLTDDQLLSFTDQALDTFADIEQMVVARDTIHLKTDDGHHALKMLARWGSRTYRELFNSEAREILNLYMPLPAPGDPPWRPTFISEQVPFLWELLYDGERYQDGDPNMFWGLRSAPARVLDTRRDNFQYAAEQVLPSDMLFCLHHRLRQAHMTEWPAIEKLVQATTEDSFYLLHTSAAPSVENEPGIKDGEELLRYLDASPHNMVHFACHCRQLAAGNDALEVSLIADDQADDVQLITLETYTFTDAGDGAFLRQPLVFLNACRAAGGPDSLRKVFNLPRKFVERGAGAVVAAACPVPDRFAAAFASQFYRFFLGEPHLAIGDALRETRWYFLREHNNPLGLAYGLYTPAHYRIAKAPAAIQGGP
jgi:CHAT domain